MHSDSENPSTDDTCQLDYAEFAALSRELIETSARLRFRAHGRSMLPTIRCGDILTIEKADATELRIGDIVMIRTAAGSILVHRLIKRKANTLTTCGDALYAHDESIPNDQLIGIVRAIEHNGREKPTSKIRDRLMVVRSAYGSSLIRKLKNRLNLRSRQRSSEP